MLPYKKMMDTALMNNQLFISQKRLKSLNFFWIGFLIYSVSSLIPPTAFWTYKMGSMFETLGLFLMIATIMSLIRFKIDSQYLRLVYFLYCTWLCIVVLRGFHLLLDYKYLTSFLFDPFLGMLYFAPLALLFPRNFTFYKKLFDVIVLFGFFYVILDIIFIKYILNSDIRDIESQGIVEYFSNLSFSCGFILLTISYHTKKRRYLAIAVVVLGLLFAIIRARRGLVFMYGNMIFLSYILYFFHSKAKLLIVYLTLCLILIAALYVNADKISDSRLLRGFTERVGEDSRSYVESYFYADMKTGDWIIGKGWNGQYFCPGVEEGEIYRAVIETGYEQTILKGGLISLGLLLLIAIPAIIKGIFYSHNILSKAAGIWILMSQVNSYPGTPNAFTLGYLIVWIAIGICYSKEIRNMSDEEIKNILNNTNINWKIT